MPLRSQRPPGVRPVTTTPEVGFEFIATPNTISIDSFGSESATLVPGSDSGLKGSPDFFFLALFLPFLRAVVLPVFLAGEEERARWVSGMAQPRASHERSD